MLILPSDCFDCFLNLFLKIFDRTLFLMLGVVDRPFITSDWCKTWLHQRSQSEVIYFQRFGACARHVHFEIIYRLTLS